MVDRRVLQVGTVTHFKGDQSMRQLKWLNDAEIHANADALAAVLLDCIAGGASVSFMADFQADQARQFFLLVATDLTSAGRALVVDLHHERLGGTSPPLLDTPTHH